MKKEPTDDDDSASAESHGTRKAKLLRALKIKRETSTSSDPTHLKQVKMEPVVASIFQPPSAAEPASAATPDGAIDVKPDAPSLTAEEQVMMDAMDNRIEVKKRPSAVSKKPAGCVKVKTEIQTIANKTSKVPIPTKHGSLSYRGGRIYTIRGQKKFRAIKDLARPSQEKMIKWKHGAPAKNEWTEALKSVDSYWDGK